VIDIARLPAVVADAARVESTDSSAPAARVPLAACGLTPASSLVIVSRAVFDAALVEAAVRDGATLIPEQVVDLTRADHGGFVLSTSETTHAADVVIGADGTNSVVRKKLAEPFRRTQLSVAAGFFVHGVTSTTIDIKSMREQPGYLWSFPRPDHLAVGICAAATERTPASVLRHQSAAWIRDHGIGGAAAMQPYAWPIPSAGFETGRRRRAAGPGWMLVGDAAGLVDALTREGIYYALLSGQWAAEALINSSSISGSKATGAARLYQSRLDDQVHPELGRAAAHSTTFFAPAFSALFVEALRESAAIRQVFVDLVSGTQPYRGLRRRLLRTREWTLARKAIQLAVMPSFTGTMIDEPSSRESKIA